MTASDSTRAMPAEDVARIANRIFGPGRVKVVENLEEAIKGAIADTRGNSAEYSIGVVITGSVVTVGQSRAILKRLSSD